MKRKSQIKHVDNFKKRGKTLDIKDSKDSNINFSNSQNNFSSNISSQTLTKTDNKSILQYFENGKIQSNPFFPLKEKETYPISKSNQIPIATQFFNKEKLILEEVHLARKNKELLLINKGLNNHIRTKENQNNKFRNNREHFSKIIFPLVIKSTLGIAKNKERKFEENLFKCKIISDETTTDECIKLSPLQEHEQASKEFNTIGFISKEISVIIKELMKIDLLTIDVLADMVRTEIFIIVSFSNLAIYSTNVENISFNREREDNCGINLFRFKSSYLIPIEIVKTLNDFFFNLKCLNNKLEVYKCSDGVYKIKEEGESGMILEEYLKTLDYMFKLINSNSHWKTFPEDINNTNTAGTCKSYLNTNDPEISTLISQTTFKDNIIANKLQSSIESMPDQINSNVTKTINIMQLSKSSSDAQKEKISFKEMNNLINIKLVESAEKSKSYKNVMDSDQSRLNSHSKNDEEPFDNSDDEEGKKHSSYTLFLLMNIEYILSTASNFSFLFHKNELLLNEVYRRDLAELEKEIVSKFLTRSTLWISRQKIKNMYKDTDEKTISQSIKNLVSLKLIKTVDSIFEENFYSDDNSNADLLASASSFDLKNYKSEFFTFLFHLNNDDLKVIQTELSKLTKYSQKVNSCELICDEIFLNNSFFRLNKYVDFGLFKEINESVSLSITKHNFEKKSEKELEDKTKSRFLFNGNEKNSSSSGPNMNIKYISNFLNATNFKKVKISKFNFTNKMSIIFQIIKTVDFFLNDKSSSIMENFIITKNSKNNITSKINLKNDKKEKILKIFSQFNMFTLNHTFAKVFDCATRLFFFYSDYKDINDVAKEFYGYESFEKFENFVSNKQILNENKPYLRAIFTTIKEFKLYDNLYQIKNSYLINSMIFNSNELNFEIGINFCFYLMQMTNLSLIKKLFPSFAAKYEEEKISPEAIYELDSSYVYYADTDKNKSNSIPNLNFNSFSEKSFKKSEIDFMVAQIESDENFSDENQSSYLDTIVNLLLCSNFSFVEENFLSKYKFGHLAAEILNYLAESCEKLKKYKLAAFIFSYLLLSSSLNKKRGLWWYRLILIFNKYIKNKSVCVKLLNRTSGDPYIKSGNLVKIKKYFEMFLKERSKEEKSKEEKNSKKAKGKNSKINKDSEPKEKTITSKSKSYLDDLDLEGNILKTNLETYDEKTFIDKKRTIQADSLFNKATGRRLYSLNHSLVTVEEYAIGYYNTLSYQGVHGENAILPALYNIFFWDIIFYDKIPFVFQSPYQTFPLDFFTGDFYLNRKNLIDNRCEEISKFTEVDVRGSFEYIFSKKKNTKSVFINWNSIFNDKEVLIKISLAIGMNKLALCFLEFAKNLKFMIKGMPDLFLWKENKNCSRENTNSDIVIGSNFNNAKSIYSAIKGSALLVEVKSKNDKLSDYQKYWLHFLTKIEVNVEVLHID